MSRGPRPVTALIEARGIAQKRGIVQVNGENPESLYDFAIVPAGSVAFVRVKYAPRVLCPNTDLAGEYCTDIARLAMLPVDTAVSRELWLRSKHGTWRFFRVAGESLVELTREGALRTGPVGRRGS